MYSVYSSCEAEGLVRMGVWWRDRRHMANSFHAVLKFPSIVDIVTVGGSYGQTWWNNVTVCHMPWIVFLSHSRSARQCLMTRTDTTLDRDWRTESDCLSLSTTTRQFCQLILKYKHNVILRKRLLCVNIAHLWALTVIANFKFGVSQFKKFLGAFCICFAPCHCFASCNCCHDPFILRSAQTCPPFTDFTKLALPSRCSRSKLTAVCFSVRVSLRVSVSTSGLQPRQQIHHRLVTVIL